MDACKLGMGGVWLPPAQRLPNSISPSKVTALRDPVLWRTRFPMEVQDSLVSATNLNGDITNSDLELAGTIAHDDILASTVPVTHLCLCTFCDNIPAVSW